MHLIPSNHFLILIPPSSTVLGSLSSSFSFLNFFLWLPQDSTILVLPNHVTPLLPLTCKKCALVIHCHKINYLQTSWLKWEISFYFLFPMVLDVDCLIGVLTYILSCRCNQECRAGIFLRTYSGMSGSWEESD